MNSFRNIKINGKIFKLDLSNGSKPSYSGTVYQLSDGKDNLAIKIYRDKPKNKYEMKNIWFPKEESLDQFIKVSEDIYPILLSKSKVLDEEDNYIGCSSYYVTETQGSTKEFIYEMPIDMLFENLYSLKKQISVISKARIILDDWRLDNIKYGTITKFPNIERIYSFDDSSYVVSDISSDEILNINYQVFDGLANDLLHYFYNQNKLDSGLYFSFRLSLKAKKNTFEYIEKNSRGYNNLKEFLLDYPKVYKK